MKCCSVTRNLFTKDSNVLPNIAHCTIHKLSNKNCNNSKVHQPINAQCCINTTKNLGPYNEYNLKPLVRFRIVWHKWVKNIPNLIGLFLS